MDPNIVRSVLYAQLPIDEASRSLVYDDATSKTLVLGAKLIGNPTIGIGRNLLGKGISESEKIYLLSNDVTDVFSQLDNSIPWWRSLDSVRASVLANMCFNMGVAKLLTFKKFLYALKVADWNAALVEMKDSAWWNQVGQRAVRLGDEIITGKSPNVKI